MPKIKDNSENFFKKSLSLDNFRKNTKILLMIGYKKLRNHLEDSKNLILAQSQTYK